MSHGTDASKDAESAAQPSDPQSIETRAGSSEVAKSTREADLAPPIPETEEALNVPKNETVGMLAVVSALTLILWFAARLACNAHPDQVREPKHFSTAELSADPKNAAFEFHHSFETGDYTTALDLAQGELKSVVEQKLIECENSPDACADNQKTLAGSVNSTGSVLEQEPTRATVELVSFYRKALEPKTFQFTVEKRGDFWRVTSRKEVPNRVAKDVGRNAEAPATAEAAATATAEAAATAAAPANVEAAGTAEPQ